MPLSNLEKLEESIKSFTFCPFFLLEKKEQARQKKTLINIFFSLSTELEENTHIEKLINILDNKAFNELEFSKNLKFFLISLSIECDESLKNLIKLLNILIERAEPFYIAQHVAEEKHKTMSNDAIKKHDKNILSMDMQLYALDYFLLMYKTLLEEHNEKIIFQGVNELPSLFDDAQNEDMLKKIVYNLFDKELMMRMVEDYYKYKNFFCEISENSIITSGIKAEVIKVLGKYILSIIIASESAGLTDNNNGLYLPYGKIEFSKLKEIVNFKQYEN